MMKRIPIVHALLVLISFSLSSQSIKNIDAPCNGKFPVEKVTLITDRDYYISGEEIWFKAYVFVEGRISSDWSKVLYLELYNEKKDVFSQQKYQIENGMIAGLLKIPSEINTGNYFLRAYTQYGRNFSVENFFTTVISIVNPQSEPIQLKAKDAYDKEDLNLISLDDQKSVIPLDLSLSHKTVRAREQIELKILNKLNANLTVVVRKKGTGYSREDLKFMLSLNPWLAQSFLMVGFQPDQRIFKPLVDWSVEKLSWVPEMRALTLSGKVVDRSNGNPVKDIYCLSTVIDGQPQIHLSRTDEEGDFIFSLPYLNDDKDIFVGFKNSYSKDLEILINKDFSTSFVDLKAIPLLFDSSRHELIEELYLNSQLNMNFQPESVLPAYSLPVDRPGSVNIGNPDVEVKITDFIYISALNEVFREIIPTVSVRGTKGNQQLMVFDRVRLKYFENPLVLLDNVPVSDIDKLMEIDPKNLSSIKVYNSKYLLGDYFFEGIISLHSHTDNFAGFKWTDNSVFLNYKTLHPQATFHFPDYENSFLRKDRKADFRTILYWNPGWELEEKNSKINFFSSDHQSEYEVIVRGYTDDGIFCFGSIEFEVVE